MVPFGYIIQVLDGSYSTGEKMVTVDQAIIAKLEKDGKHFEILVDPVLAYELKEGKTVSLSKMLAVNAIFTDSKKGLKAGEGDVENILGTTDIEQAAKIIIEKGDIQLTTDFRRRKIDEKKKQIANFISKYAINPQTKMPHPAERILASMDQAHVSIDPFMPAEQQVDDVMKLLKPVIPISMEELTITIQIPAQYAGRAYGKIKELGSIQNQNWLTDGSLSAQLTIPAGLKENVYRIINSLTNGEARIEEK